MSYNYWGAGPAQPGSSSNQPPQRYPSAPPGRQQVPAQQQPYYSQVQQAPNPYESYPAAPAGYNSASYGWGSDSSGNSLSAYANAAAAYAAASQAHYTQQQGQPPQQQQQPYNVQYDAGGYPGANSGYPGANSGYPGANSGYTAAFSNRGRAPGMYNEQAYPPAFGYHQSAPFQPLAPRAPMNDIPPRGVAASRRGRGAAPRSLPSFSGIRPPSVPFPMATPTYQQSVASNRGRGGRGRGRGGRGGRQEPAAPQQQFFCEICKITCGGEVTYKEHLKGSKHTKKEQMVRNQSEVPVFAKTKVTYRCDICDCACTGWDTYETHAKGARHQRTLALLKQMNKPIPSGPTVIDPVGDATKNIVTVDEVAKGEGEPTKEASVDPSVIIINDGAEPAVVEGQGPVPQTPMNGEVQLPIVGREFIEMQTDPATGKVNNYLCKLCNCSFTDPNAQDHHLKGRRHRNQYKMKVDPQIEAESLPMANKKNRKLHAKNRQNYQLSQEFKFVEPMNFVPVEKRSLTNDDLYVMDKDAEIVATPEEMERNVRVLSLAEQALQSVSNLMIGTPIVEGQDAAETNPSSEASAPAAAPPAAENPRVLQGAIRVGDVTKFLLRKNDEKKIVNLVVLMSKVPSFSFVATVRDKLAEVIKEDSFQAQMQEGEQFTIEEDPEKVRLLMKEQNTGITVRMTFTCYLVREALIAEAKGESITVEKPADPLPTDSCLEALANLRRCKWFQERCCQLSACVPVIRVMRYVRDQNLEWHSLSEHLLELLVEKAIRTAGIPLSPGDGLRRVFEMLSSGFLIAGQPGLVDPCEVEKADILSKMPMDSRLQITESAQNILRLIAMNQLYRVLGLAKRESSPSNATVAAKEDIENSASPGENERKRRLEECPIAGETVPKKDKCDNGVEDTVTSNGSSVMKVEPEATVPAEINSVEVPLVKQEGATQAEETQETMEFAENVVVPAAPIKAETPAQAAENPENVQSI